MGFKDSAKQFGTKFKLDSHHAMERFGIFFGVFTLVALLLLVTTGFSATGNNRAAMTSKTVYTPTFTTSKTELGGNFVGVYTNEDSTRAVALMHFNTKSPMSTKASSYQAFLSGMTADARSEALKADVAGEVVVFGSSGYMGVVLDTDEPFPLQIMNLTMRSESELVYSESSKALRDDLKSDASFSKHDQWRVFFNPGADGVIPAKSLNEKTFNAASFYTEVVLGEREVKAREDLDAQLGEMRAALARINEYEDALTRTNMDGVFIVPPAVPVQIAGDRVEYVGDEEDGVLELKTDWVSPRGYDFDWRSGTVSEGYLDAIVPQGESFGRFLADKAQTPEDEADKFDISAMEWMLTDGTSLMQTSTSGVPSAMKDLVTLKTNLSTAYAEYFKLKQDYQVKLHAALLELEVEQRSIESNYSINDSEEALIVY